MDARYAGALRAFISHNPSASPIDPGAPDPLRDRAPERTTLPRTAPIKSGSAASDGAALLPLIFAQMPLEPTYRFRRPPSSPMRPRMNGR